MRYRVALADGSNRVFDYRPEVGMAGELSCQVDLEVVDALSTSLEAEDVIYAAGEWKTVEPIAENGTDR